MNEERCFIPSGNAGPLPAMHSLDSVLKTICTSGLHWLRRQDLYLLYLWFGTQGDAVIRKTCVNRSLTNALLLHGSGSAPSSWDLFQAPLLPEHSKEASKEQKAALEL